MNFGFVSTRFAGTDGVSLESAKWAEVFERCGHSCFWFSGLSDRDAGVSEVVSEAHFAHPRIEAINAQIWHRDTIPAGIGREIADLRARLHRDIGRFTDRFAIDVLVPENALTIPMNLPLGLALTDFLRDRQWPALAHHHDFHWERDRFGGRAALPFLEEAFPPLLPGIAHAVIHSGAARDLDERFGIAGTVIPNVMDFARPTPPLIRDTASLRMRIGLEEGDRLILQPTRVVPRKGIEHAIELVHRLGDSRNKLVVSHEAGDEGLGYRDRLLAIAREKSVDLRFLDPDSSPPTLEELYALADFVTFPSLYEGFGNALLEAVLFRRPVLVNRYPVFVTDIEPCGFEFVTMDGGITDGVVAAVERILTDPESATEATAKNHRLAGMHFGYDTLTIRLREILASLGRKL